MPFCITLQDLISCGVGDVIVSMLIDAKAFYDYDQRESGETEDFEDFWNFKIDFKFILVIKLCIF